MAERPVYHLPAGLLMRLGLDWLLARRRDFSADARACLRSGTTPVRVAGGENIPVGGACLVTFNHYSRPGFQIYWLVMALTAALRLGAGQRLGAVVTGELTMPGSWLAPVGRPFSRVLLRRMAQMYGFVSMPPMPPRQCDVDARARSVRAVLAWLDQPGAPVLLLAPEGCDQPGGRLATPPEGAGRFMALITARGLPVLPVAGWEGEGALQLRFGRPYHLAVPAGLSRDQLDRQISTLVMSEIAALLPDFLRGEFQA
jgi:hypothetical protein